MAPVTATQTQKDPSNPHSDTMSRMVQQGTQALEDGNLMAALEAFEKVVQAYPQRPEGHNNLGAMYSALGETRKAEACFNRVIRILPDNTDIYYNRGVVRSRQEKFDGAREDFLKVLAAHPDDTDTLNNLGVMDFMQGHLDSARRYFQRAIESKQDNVSALLNLVDLEMAARNSPVAVKLCEDFLDNHRSLEVRRKLLELLSSGCRDSLERASRVAETLIGAGDENATTRQELGRLTKARNLLNSEAT